MAALQVGRAAGRMAGNALQNAREPVATSGFVHSLGWQAVAEVQIRQGECFAEAGLIPFSVAIGQTETGRLGSTVSAVLRGLSDQILCPFEEILVSAKTRPLRFNAPLAALAVFMLSGPTWADQPGKSPVKVFILSGQSNMEGQGTIEGDKKGTLRFLVKDPSSAQRYKHLLDKDGNWVVRDDVWIWSLPRKEVQRRGKLTVGYGGSDRVIGPEFGFGLAVGEHLGNQVLLIKIAWGGKSLAKDFRPPSSGGQVGDSYSGLIKYAKEVLENLKTHFPDYDGRGYEIAGFGWHQGWNDGCGWEATKEYEKNLANFIRDLRKEFGVKDMPLVIANSGFAGRQQKVDRRLEIMKAQAAVAEYEEFKGNVICVETRDFFRPFPSRHNYHWNNNGETLYLIGDAMGKAMVKLLGGRGKGNRLTD